MHDKTIKKLLLSTQRTA